MEEISTALTGLFLRPVPEYFGAVDFIKKLDDPEFVNFLRNTQLDDYDLFPFWGYVEDVFQEKIMEPQILQLKRSGRVNSSFEADLASDLREMLQDLSGPKPTKSWFQAFNDARAELGLGGSDINSLRGTAEGFLLNRKTMQNLLFESPGNGPKAPSSAKLLNMNLERLRSRVEFIGRKYFEILLSDTLEMQPELRRIGWVDLNEAKKIGNTSNLDGKFDLIQASENLYEYFKGKFNSKMEIKPVEDTNLDLFLVGIQIFLKQRASLISSLEHSLRFPQSDQFFKIIQRVIDRTSEKPLFTSDYSLDKRLRILTSLYPISYWQERDAEARAQNRPVYSVADFKRKEKLISKYSDDTKVFANLSNGINPDRSAKNDSIFVMKTTKIKPHSFIALGEPSDYEETDLNLPSKSSGPRVKMLVPIRASKKDSFLPLPTLVGAEITGVSVSKDRRVVFPVDSTYFTIVRNKSDGCYFLKFPWGPIPSVNVSVSFSSGENPEEVRSDFAELHDLKREAIATFSNQIKSEFGGSGKLSASLDRLVDDKHPIAASDLVDAIAAPSIYSRERSVNLEKIEDLQLKDLAPLMNEDQTLCAACGQSAAFLKLAIDPSLPPGVQTRLLGGYVVQNGGSTVGNAHAILLASNQNRDRTILDATATKKELEAVAPALEKFVMEKLSAEDLKKLSPSQQAALREVEDEVPQETRIVFEQIEQYKAARSKLFRTYQSAQINLTKLGTNHALSQTVSATSASLDFIAGKITYVELRNKLQRFSLMLPPQEDLMEQTKAIVQLFEDIKTRLNLLSKNPRSYAFAPTVIVDANAVIGATTELVKLFSRDSMLCAKILLITGRQ